MLGSRFNHRRLLICLVSLVGLLSGLEASLNGWQEDGRTNYLPITVASAGTNGAIPSCPPAAHDPTRWHPLIAPDNSCHYDHEHKHNPDDAADIFGPAGEWFGGSSISYPWQTTHENELKHEAYSWIVRREIPSHGRDVWIKAFRWQVHATSAPFTNHDGTLHGGYLSRFHSHSLEAQVCNSSGQCGIVRTGGWIDFGHLEIEGVEACVSLPSDPTQEETCSSLGRRRLHYFYPGEGIPRSSAFFWYGRAGLPNGDIPALHPVQLSVATNDGSVNLIPDDLYTLHFFCPAWDCALNNSTIQAHVIGFAVPSRFDPDGDGLADFSGYTDRYGVVMDNCVAPALDCVPLVVEGAPVGKVQHRDSDDLGLSAAGERDFDSSPPGEWWIRYPTSPTSSPADDPHSHLQGEDALSGVASPHPRRR